MHIYARGVMRGSLLSRTCGTELFHRTYSHKRSAFVGFLWFLKIFDDLEWFSLFLYALEPQNQWFSMIFSDFQRCSRPGKRRINDFQWFSTIFNVFSMFSEPRGPPEAPNAPKRRPQREFRIDIRIELILKMVLKQYSNLKQLWMISITDNV